MVASLTAFNFLGNDADAKDALQEAYISAWKNLDDLKEPKKVTAWFDRIVINKCKDEIKKKNPLPVEKEVIEEVLFEESYMNLPEEYVLDADKRNIVLEIMRRNLTTSQYETIWLYYFSELSVKEIATELGISESAVKNRLSISRSKIKKAVFAYERKNDTKLYGLASAPVLG